MRLFILFVTIFVAAQATNVHLSSWNSFKVQHNKQYSSLIEEQYRLHIFKTNLELINRHNAEADLGLHSYRLGVNQFADMSHEEFAKKMLHPMKPSQTKLSQRSWEMPANIELPAAIDWREKGAVIKVIESQGNCGSCWAFTATGALEAQHFLKTKKLIRLSAQNLMDCSESFGNHGCEGGLMDNAFEYVKANKGIDSEATYPYEEKDGTCRFNRSNVAATATGYVDLPAKNETALQIALATVGPISVAVDAGHASFQFYSSGVYDEPACSTTNLDHSFVLVGYDTYKNGTVSKDYYNAKNSWGDKWGLKGYIWMSRNKKNQCGIANMGSYPTV